MKISKLFFICKKLYTDEHLKWDKPPMTVCLFK